MRTRLQPTQSGSLENLMPIITGLALAASMTTAMQDDLINEKHYAVVKTGEQSSSLGGTTTSGQGGAAGCATTVTPAQEVSLVNVQDRVDVPSLAELPIVGQMFSSSNSSQLKRIPEYSKPVSCSFVDASSSDVLKWLSKQGVNFAGASESMPKGKLSLNLKNVPLYEALDAIAEVLGGSWSLRGKTLVFRAGRSFAFSMEPAAAIAPLRSRVDPKRPYELVIPPIAVPGVELNIRQDAFADIAKFHELPKGLSKEDQEKMRKEMERAHEEMQKAFKELRMNAGSLNMSKEELAKMEASFAKTREELKRSQLASGERASRLKAPIVASEEGYGKLLKSLTDQQLELHKKQGYLKFSDLTKQQLGFINADGPIDVKITISYSKDGKSITLKN